jgi:hypothetical protein
LVACTRAAGSLTILRQIAAGTPFDPDGIADAAASTS